MLDQSARDLLDLPENTDGCRIAVAMSGGVDSSLAAAICAEAGCDVFGLTLQLYNHGVSVGRSRACCAGQDIHDARRVADQLQIPHYVLDYEERFRAAVIDDFADTYAAGATPVPCARCNERVKFKDLLETAMSLGAEFLVTGHYVASRSGKSGRTLHRAADRERDQSYFMFTTTGKQLERLRFPLGDMTKKKTRELARGLSLSVADKPDSQDICFVPQGHYSSLVERLRPDAGEPGDIIDIAGEVLGRHEGIARYTVGQRRGLGLATGEPLYVLRIDASKRQVVVGAHEELEIHFIEIKDVNWIGQVQGMDVSASVMPVFVKIRSTQEPVAATFRISGKCAVVHFDKPEFGVSPGQACVVYDGSGAGARVLGGGWIDRCEGRGAQPGMVV